MGSLPILKTMGMVWVAALAASADEVVAATITATCRRTSSAAKMVLPVTFAPGRLRLATRPNATGSAPVAKTMGMVVVAAFAASGASGPVAAPF